MGIYTNLIIGGFGHCIEIVIVHPLSVMMFTTWDDITHITTLHCIISIVHHELISLVHMAFVITYGSRSFVVHHQLHTFAGSIGIQHLHIKIGIRSHKIEYIIFWLAEPVFPTFVPAFYQYLVESVLGCKVNIAFHIFVVGTVLAVRFRFWIIRFA